MNKLDELKALRKAVIKERDRLDKEIEKIQRAEAQPEFEAMIGKFYKYHNAGGDENWWTYIYITSVSSYNFFSAEPQAHFKAITFQKLFNEYWQILSADDVSSSYSFEVEITRAEFMREYKKALKAIEVE